MKYTLLLLTIVSLLSACGASVTPQKLYGRWKYIYIKHLSGDPPDIPRDELERQQANIQFLTNNNLAIIWGGKVVSHGKFRTEGQNIQYTETLADGKTRTFPFWVSKLTEKDLVFETKGADGSRVTAVKVGH